jgi:hypothetical protein
MINTPVIPGSLYVAADINSTSFATPKTLGTEWSTNKLKVIGITVTAYTGDAFITIDGTVPTASNFHFVAYAGSSPRDIVLGGALLDNVVVGVSTMAAVVGWGRNDA